MIRIVKLNRQFLDGVKTISDEQFGLDYLKKEDFEIYLAKPHLGLVALNAENQIMGLTLIKIGNVSEIAEELLSGREWFIDKFAENSKIALRKHLAVKKGTEGSGIGKLLMKEGMKELLNLKADAIVSVVWKEGSADALDKMLSDFDSKPIKLLEDYWKEDSIQKKYICPGCKKLPCSCSALVYAVFPK